MLIDWLLDFFRNGFKRKKRFCDWHHKKETFIEGESFMCYECGHVFAGEDDLLFESNRKLAGLGAARKTNSQDVTFCPFCYHDF